MKKILAIIFILGGLTSMAQIEVSPMVGYFFGGKTNLYDGSIKIQDNVNYGLHLGFDMGHNSGIELSYAMSPSVAQWRPNFSFGETLPAKDFDLDTHIFLIGGLKGLQLPNEKMIVFGGFKVGAVMYHPRSSSLYNINDLWRFLVGINAGLKILITEKVGIRLQGNMYMPMYFNGGGMYCGIGSGGSSCGASVNGTVVIFQGDLTAGLIFKLGQ